MANPLLFEKDMITLQTVKPANVKLPNLYRYLETEYIDSFFEKGMLRFGSFLKFRTYPDEIRGDKSEGTGAMVSKTQEGMTLVGSTEAGMDAYILCTSVIESEELMKEFKTNGSFRIKDPLGFSLAVANAIPGFSQAVQGFCNYQDLRLVNKEMPGMSTKEFTDEQGHLIIGGGLLNRLGGMTGDGTDLMFLKEKKYQKQAEYRFFWRIDSKFFKLQEYADIECKEAIQFCERIDGH